MTGQVITDGNVLPQSGYSRQRTALLDWAHYDGPLPYLLRSTF